MRNLLITLLLLVLPSHLYGQIEVVKAGKTVGNTVNITNNYADIGWKSTGNYVHLNTTADSIGIGLSTPSTLVHILGSPHVWTLIETNVANGGTANLQLLHSNNNSGWMLRANNGGKLLFGRANTAGTATDTTATFESGKLGIKTISPAYELHVMGTVAVGDTATATSNRVIYFAGDGSVTSKYLKHTEADVGFSGFYFNDDIFSSDSLIATSIEATNLDVTTIKEKTSGSGVVVDGIKILDTGVQVDSITNKTASGNIDITLATGDTLLLNSRRVLTTADIAGVKDPFWLGEDQFPLDQMVYSDSTYNNIDSTNYMVIQSISGSGSTRNVVLNWLPYKNSLFSPTSGKEWAMLCTSSWGDLGTEPNRSGDATDILRITSGTYSTKTLTCYQPSGWGLSAGDTVIIYNPFGGSWAWSDSFLVAPSGTGTANGDAGWWRKKYVNSGPVWLNSDGYMRMLVNGANKDAGTIQTVGLYKFHPDSIFDASSWTVLNGDTALIDTSAAAGRAAGVLCMSVLKLNTQDAYIGYTMQSNASSIWRISYVIFDEDGVILKDPGTDILATKPTGGSVVPNDLGQGSPSVVRYGGKYLMTFADRDSNASMSWANVHNNTKMWTATASIPTGPFTTGDSVTTSNRTKKASYRSGYSDAGSIFIYKGRIYGIMAGTSVWHQSGSKSNRWWGIVYRNERDGSPVWIDDHRGPLWINVMQKYANHENYEAIWGTGQGSANQYYYASDHSGGYPVFYSNPTDGYVYMFMSSNSTSDDYHIWGMKLDASLF